MAFSLLILTILSHLQNNRKHGFGLDLPCWFEATAITKNCTTMWEGLPRFELSKDISRNKAKLSFSFLEPWNWAGQAPHPAIRRLSSEQKPGPTLGDQQPEGQKKSRSCLAVWASVCPLDCLPLEENLTWTRNMWYDALVWNCLGRSAWLMSLKLLPTTRFRKNWVSRKKQGIEDCCGKSGSLFKKPHSTGQCH